MDTNWLDLISWIISVWCLPQESGDERIINRYVEQVIYNLLFD